MPLSKYRRNKQLREQAAKPGISPDALEKAQRDAKLASLRAEKAAQGQKEAQDKLAQAQKDIELANIRNAVLAASGSAVNPEHVADLYANKFVMHGGRPVLAADPTKSIETFLADEFKDKGKYLLRPNLPGGGAPLPGTSSPNSAVQGKALDIKTPEGMTARARSAFDNSLPRNSPVFAQANAQSVAPKTE